MCGGTLSLDLRVTAVVVVARCEWYLQLRMPRKRRHTAFLLHTALYTTIVSVNFGVRPTKTVLCAVAIYEPVRAVPT